MLKSVCGKSMLIMKPYKYILTLALFTSSLIFTAANAQTDNTTGEISGKVLDEQQKAFPYATISLLNAKDSITVRGTLTSDNGTYQIKEIKQGNYLIAIYVVGYKKVFKGPYTISPEKKTHDLGNVQLATDSKELKGVEIVKQKPLIERQIDKTVINVENSALAAGNTALDILQKSPGITVDKDGKISLKGKQGVT